MKLIKIIAILWQDDKINDKIKHLCFSLIMINQTKGSVLKNSDYDLSIFLNHHLFRVTTILLAVVIFMFVISVQGVLASTVDQSAEISSENDSAPSHYTAIAAPVHLHVIDRSDMSLDEYQMITSLQGLLAQVEPRIYVTDVNQRDSYNFWLESMKSNNDVTTELRTDAMAILEDFKDDVSGYLLTQGGGVPGGWGTEETNAATSLAGIKNGIVISESLKPAIDDMGLEKILDVRGMTNEEVFNEYKDELNNNLLITQNYNIMQLRDYAIATQAFVYHETDDEPAGFEDEVYSWVAPDSPQFGWGWAFKDKDEREYVGDAGMHGIFTNPSDWVMNLSTLAGVQVDSLSQKRDNVTVDNINTPQEAHYLAITMSDGDNYSYVLQGLADDGIYFDSPASGEFPINWTIPGSMIDLAPSAMQWYYEEAKDTDYFVIGGTGSGYMFPSEYPYLEDHLEIVNEYMGRSDLSYIGMLDPADFGSETFYETASKYTEKSNIRGVYYVNYYQYEAGAGQMEFINGKPVVAMRENMWGLSDPEIIELAQKINNHATNPENPEAYSIMNLHAWTHNLEDAKLLIDNLDPHVKVVNMDEFFQQIVKNVDPDYEPDHDDRVFGENLLANHNFADGFDYWRCYEDWNAADCHDMDRFELDPSDDGQMLFYTGGPLIQIFSDRIGVESGKVYKLEALVDVYGKHNNGANYKLRFYDGNGDFIDETEHMMPEDTDGFVDVGLTMEAPLGAAELDVEMAVWHGEDGMPEFLVDMVKVRKEVEEATSIDEGEIADRPEQVHLEQNYPNPFNHLTQIAFSVPEASKVALNVYNIQGQHITTLVDENISAGRHQVTFDGSNLSSGIYMYRIQVNDKVQTRTMTLIK